MTATDKLATHGSYTTPAARHHDSYHPVNLRVIVHYRRQA